MSIFINDSLVIQTKFSFSLDEFYIHRLPIIHEKLCIFTIMAIFTNDP